MKAMPDRCEEASVLSTETYIPCNAPAEREIADRDGVVMRMCAPCAAHSVNNRGMTDVGPYVSTSTERDPRPSAAPSFLKAAVKDAPRPVVDEDRLVALRTEVAKVRDLEAEKADAEERLKTLNVSIYEAVHKTLPDMFDEVGVQSIELAPDGNNPGVSAKASPYYKASISADWDPEKRADAFKCLEEEGAEDIIKVQVTCSFPRGYFEAAKEFADQCRDSGMQVVLKEEVPWGTLTSWLKESVEKHNHIPPLDRIGGTVGRIVKIKALKS